MSRLSARGVRTTYGRRTEVTASPEPYARSGSWSAVAVTVFSLVFSTSGLLGLAEILRFPWDPVIPDVASLLLAVAFVVMMVSLHYSVQERVRLWTHLGLCFAVMYAVLVGIVYFVITTVVVPYVDRGQADRVSLLEFDEGGSFMQALDGLGYFFMSLATLAAALAFSSHGPDRWLRRAFLWNGVLGLPILLLYMPLVVTWSEYLMPIGAMWMLSVPACGVTAALHFRDR